MIVTDEVWTSDLTRLKPALYHLDHHDLIMWLIIVITPEIYLRMYLIYLRNCIWDTNQLNIEKSISKYQMFDKYQWSE